MRTTLSSKLKWDSLHSQAHYQDISGNIGPRPASRHRIRILRVELHVPLQTSGGDCCQILIQRPYPLRTRQRTRNNGIDPSIIRKARSNINNNGSKTLPWSIPETTSNDTLTLPSKRTFCLLSLRNSDTVDNNCPPTPLDLSLHSRP